MKGRLAWACGGIAALVLVVIWRTGGTSSGARDELASRAAVSPAPPTPGSIPRESTPAGPLSTARLTESLRHRFSDDTLPPPPETAPAADHREYERLLREINAGRDPIHSLTGDPKIDRKTILDRLKTRSEAAKKRLSELAAARSARAREFQAQHRERLLRAGIDPDSPAPILVPPPELGPAVIEIDPVTGEKKAAPAPEKK